MRPFSAAFSFVLGFALCAQGSAAPASFKVAFYNIRSGQGAQPLRGHSAPFADGGNCDPGANRPLNAWGTGVVRRELDRLSADPQVVALGLAEAWACASPRSVTQALRWRQHTADHNGTALVARYGFSGKDEWLQLDTSQNTNPKDQMWVVRAAVCLDERCGSTVDIYAAHWYGTGPLARATQDRQAADTVKFMSRSRGPHVLVGDLNVFEGASEVCHQKPNNTTLDVLRQAGYADAWPAMHPNEEGFTGMLNRAGCGSPEGAPWKRIDYAWSRGLTPTSIDRFGLPEPGEAAPSDHAGIVAAYRF